MLPNSVSYCRAKPFKVSAAAPRPREKGRFRVAISDRPPSPPWDLQLPEIGVLRTAYCVLMAKRKFIITTTNLQRQRRLGRGDASPCPTSDQGEAMRISPRSLLSRLSRPRLTYSYDIGRVLLQSLR